MQHPTESETVALLDTQFTACQLVQQFVTESVRPITRRHLNALPWTQCCDGLLGRVEDWTRSVLKLNETRDFQGILAACRSVFETALDLSLVALQENRSFAKLLAWEDSERLHVARQLSVLDPQGAIHPGAGQFVSANETRVLALRQQHWASQKRVLRWTGRKLGDDATVADQLGRAAVAAGSYGAVVFEEYALHRYSRTCWYVHGSGMIGLRGASDVFIPYLVAHALRDIAKFSLAAAQYALVILDCHDPITSARVTRLESAIAAATAGILHAYTAERPTPEPSLDATNKRNEGA